MFCLCWRIQPKFLLSARKKRPKQATSSPSPKLCLRSQSSHARQPPRAQIPHSLTSGTVGTNATRSTRKVEMGCGAGRGGEVSPPAARGMACPPRAARGRGTACSTPPQPLPAPEPEPQAGPGARARPPSRRRAGPSAALSISLAASPVLSPPGGERFAAGWRRLRLLCHASRYFQRAWRLLCSSGLGLERRTGTETAARFPLLD